MGLSLRGMGKGIVDLVNKGANNIEGNAKGVARQVNPFDDGQTFNKVFAPNPHKPNYAPPDSIPTDRSTVPYYQGGKLVNQQPNTSVYQQNGLTLYDPQTSGVVGTDSPENYLAIMPNFQQFPDYQPMEYMSPTEQINRLLGR